MIHHKIDLVIFLLIVILKDSKKLYNKLMTKIKIFYNFRYILQIFINFLSIKLKKYIFLSNSKFTLLQILIEKTIYPQRLHITSRRN